MRRFLFWAALLGMMLVCACGVAESYALDTIHATIEIPDAYIVLTPDNLSNYEQWLNARETSADQAATDFANRGVLLQCWTQEQDACFEITATQNDDTLNLFDVNEQSTEVRGAYRLSFYPRNEYEGYAYSTSEWKNTKDNGRFLVLRYVHSQNSETDFRGFSRKTIRNGYEITLDYRVYDRALSNKDNAALNKLWDGFLFTEILPLPAAASAKVNITQEPPTETSEASFAIEGTAAPEVKLTAVVMGLSSPDPILFDETVGKNGKFKLAITLPREGVFMITITAEKDGEDAAEFAFPVTYQRTLLAVNITTEVPQSVTTDELSIKGTAAPGASIQVFVNNERSTKKVTNAGKFVVDVDTSKEGAYEIVLVFSKKGLADRRFVFTCTRNWSEADQLKQIAAESISPGYSTLVKKIDGYDGRVMGYSAYPVSITQSGSDWIVQMALTKRGDKYSSMILVTTGEEPNVKVGQKVRMYGTCAGMSVSAAVGENGTETTESYPCFELLKFQSIE